MGLRAVVHDFAQVIVLVFEMRFEIAAEIEHL